MRVIESGARGKVCARVHGSQADQGCLLGISLPDPLYLKGMRRNACIYHGKGAPGLGQPGKLPNMVGVCDACADEIISADCDVCVWSVGYFTRSPTCTS